MSTNITVTATHASWSTELSLFPPQDVVTETPSFDATILMEIMRDKLYTKKQYTRKFLVYWLICLIEIPHIDLVVYLPILIDPLLIILGDQNNDIQST